MAITVEQLPIDYATAYNDIVTIASSTNIAQPKFSYIFEIFDVSGTTLLNTLIISPEIDYGYGICKFNRILEGYIGTDFFQRVLGTQPKNAANCSVDYIVKYGEQYEVAGVITQYKNLTSTGVTTSFNGSLLNSSFLNYDANDYILTGVTDSFLTNFPNPIKVQLTQEGWINFLNGGTDNFKIRTYLSNGAFVQTAVISNSATTEVAMFPSAPISLNAATLDSGSQPIITSSIDHYTIEAWSKEQISKVYTFKLTHLCEYATLHFLNDLGGFDWLNFKTVKDQWTFEKEYYKQNPKRIQSDGSYVWSALDREHIQAYTNQKQKVRLVSDWLTEDESVWLREMISSPEMYLTRDGVTYAIKGNTLNEYDFKYDYEMEMYNIDFVVELSVDNYRQRY